MSKVASSTLGYRTVTEVGIATVVGAAEKDDNGANWYDLLVKDSGRFGWFTKGAQVMDIGETRQREQVPRRYTYTSQFVRLSAGCNPSPERFLEADGCGLPRVHQINAPQSLRDATRKRECTCVERNASVRLGCQFQARHKGREFR